MPPELDDVGGARELAKYRISVAKEDLSAADLNFENGMYRASNNRAYYAIFRAVSACLALEFKSYRSHRQTLGNFNKDFVNTGIFPSDFGRKIMSAQEIRHASDYDDFYVLTITDAKEQLDTAHEIVSMVDEYLQNLPEMEG